MRAFSDSTLVPVDGPAALESAIRKFTKACREVGLFTEIKKRQFYSPPSARRRVKAQQAAQRRARAARRQRENSRSDVDWKPTPAPRA